MNRRRRAERRGREAGYDHLAYETALAVCSATTPAQVLAELGGEGDDPCEAARLYAEMMTVERFRRESQDGALEGFRRQGFAE